MIIDLSEQTSLSDQTSLSEQTSLSDQTSHISRGPPDPPDPSIYVRSDEQSLPHSTPLEPFEEAKDDEYSIPDHHFDIKTSEGKVGKMKGVIRERVSLIIQSHVFSKRRQTSDGAVFFSCNDCETKASKYLSAVAKIKEDGSYELIEWPRSKDHSCWVDGNQALIKKARNEMFLKIDQDPSRSINQIYEEVRNSTTQTMTSQEKQSFLSVFPSFRQIQAKLYRKRIQIRRE